MDVNRLPVHIDSGFNLVDKHCQAKEVLLKGRIKGHTRVFLILSLNANVCFGLPAQPVDATHALILCAGVLISKIFEGRS